MMAEKKKIVAFCCENSGLLAADALEDSSILDLVEIVRLPCSGKIEIGLILKCLENGHPQVLVVGCPVDNCKYLTGNVRARKRIETVKMALRNAGVDENRVRLIFISSLDSHKFAAIVRELAERRQS